MARTTTLRHQKHHLTSEPNTNPKFHYKNTPPFIEGRYHFVVDIRHICCIFEGKNATHEYEYTHNNLY